MFIIIEEFLSKMEAVRVPFMLASLVGMYGTMAMGATVPIFRLNEHCDTQVPPTLAINSLKEQLSSDVRDVNIEATRLQNCYMNHSNTRISNSTLPQPESAMIDKFPQNSYSFAIRNETELLQKEYQNLSVVAMFCEEMIDNELKCSITQTCVPQMSTLNIRLNKTLCHLQTALESLQSPARALETRDSVVPMVMKKHAQNCTQNDAYRISDVLNIIRYTVEYTSDHNALRRYLRI